MTKEDKQIIKRATNENWRIGDRSRLKRLLKKNLELYRENVELEKENEHLRNNGFTVSAMTEQQLKVALEKGEELEKENKRLKGDLELYESGGCRATNLFECGVVKELKEQLTKAKEILKEFVQHYKNKTIYVENMQDLLEQSEQFIKDLEK